MLGTSPEKKLQDTCQFGTCLVKFDVFSIDVNDPLAFRDRENYYNSNCLVSTFFDRKRFGAVNYVFDETF